MFATHAKVFTLQSRLRLTRLKILLAQIKEYDAPWLDSGVKVSRDPGTGRFASKSGAANTGPTQLLQQLNMGQSVFNGINARVERIQKAGSKEAAIAELKQLGSDALPIAVQFLALGVAPEMLFGSSLGEALPTAIAQLTAQKAIEEQAQKIPNKQARAIATGAAELAAFAFAGAATKTGLEVATKKFGKKAVQDATASHDSLQSYLKTQAPLVKLTAEPATKTTAEAVLQSRQAEFANHAIDRNLRAADSSSGDLAKTPPEMVKQLGDAIADLRQKMKSGPSLDADSHINLSRQDLERVQSLFSPQVEKHLAQAGIDPNNARSAAIRLLNRFNKTLGVYTDSEYKYMRIASYTRFEQNILKLSKSLRDDGSAAVNTPAAQWRVRAIRAEAEHGAAVDAFQDQMVRVGRLAREHVAVPFDAMPRLVDQQFHDSRDQLASYLQGLNPGQKGSTIKTIGKVFPPDTLRRQEFQRVLSAEIAVYDTAITIGEKRTREAMEAVIQKQMEDVASVSATPIHLLAFSTKSGPGDAYYVSHLRAPKTSRLLADHGIDAKGLINVKPQRVVRETGTMDPGNVFHEVGHHLEDLLNLEAPSSRWLQERSTGPPQPMEYITSFGQPVMARPDDFQREYVGRLYELSPEEKAAGKTQPSTEVISTALESWSSVFQKDYLARHGDTLKESQRNAQEIYEAVGQGLYEHLEVDREQLMYGLDALVKGNK